MTSWGRWAVALVAVVAAAALWLPWWTAPEPTQVFAGGELTDEGGRACGEPRSPASSVPSSSY